MQAYVLLPLVYLGVFKLAKGNMNAVKISVVAITLTSLIAYLLPAATTAEKFYYLPFRAFEITMGSLIVFTPTGERITTRMQIYNRSGMLGYNPLFVVCEHCLSFGIYKITACSLCYNGIGIYIC